MVIALEEIGHTTFFSPRMLLWLILDGWWVKKKIKIISIILISGYGGSMYGGYSGMYGGGFGGKYTL